MELATITARGQIVLPITIRRKLNLKEGGKVAFIESDGEYKVVNPTRLAILEAQAAFAGLADELGIKSEEDVVELCAKLRKENWEKTNADNG